VLLAVLAVSDPVPRTIGISRKAASAMTTTPTSAPMSTFRRSLPTASPPASAPAERCNNDI
jgi:hypothetical protein